MDRVIIEEIIDNVLSTKTANSAKKCYSKSDLSSSDKEFIENFINSNEKWLDDKENQNDEAWNILEENQAKHKYTESQDVAVSYWSESGFTYINGRIYNKESYKESVEKGFANDKDVIQKTRDLQSAIDESPRIPINLVTHREGHWDKGHKAGEVIVQKGFASTGLSGGESMSILSEDPYDITYYVPTDTKGTLLTPLSYDDLFVGGGERELLLGKGTRQYILNQDDMNHEVEILILLDR